MEMDTLEIFELSSADLYLAAPLSKYHGTPIFPNDGLINPGGGVGGVSFKLAAEDPLPTRMIKSMLTPYSSL